MKRLLAFVVVATMLIVSAAPALASEDKPTIYIAGDSVAQKCYATQYPQVGWGQVFADCFNGEVTVSNYAISGRGTKRFEIEGRLDKIFESIVPGDFLFIQFGIYESNKDNEEWNASVEEYKECLKTKYIDEAEKHGAIPVLLTPCAQASWDEKAGKFKETRHEYSIATREVAEETSCKFIDINKIMTDSFNTMNKDEVLSLYMICEPLESIQKPSGKSDLSHFKEKGARFVTKLISNAIPECVPELAKYLKQTETFTDISGHWAEENIIIAQKGGLISVSDNGKFVPDSDVTRADFLEMAMNAAGIPGHGYREGECLEATDRDWYCFILQSALDKGLIPVEMTVTTIQPVERILSEATEENAAVTVNFISYMCGFKANLPITREEMAVIAVNCLLYAAKESDIKLEKTSGRVVIEDSEGNSAYFNTVKEAYSYGLIKDTDSGGFYPEDNLTRAQAVIIANRIAEKLRK